MSASRFLEVEPRRLPGWVARYTDARAGEVRCTRTPAGLELLGVLDNRNVRGPLVPLDDDEVAALREGLSSAGLLQ